MEAKAVTRFLRISPRKVRLVIGTIRRKPVDQAFSILSGLKKKGARIVEKTLKSAQANAIQKKMEESRLYVREIKADGGPSLKRYMPRSMGRADVILKRMTHLTVVLGEREAVPVRETRTEKESKGKSILPETKGAKKKKPALAAAGAK